MAANGRGGGRRSGGQPAIFDVPDIDGDKSSSGTPGGNLPN
jgi:hypothetical protein